jgi:hypothetical protein
MANDQSVERKLGQLRTWNLVVGLILAIQAILIAVLTNSFALPVTAFRSAGDGHIYDQRARGRPAYTPPPV